MKRSGELSDRNTFWVTIGHHHHSTPNAQTYEERFHYGYNKQKRGVPPDPVFKADNDPWDLGLGLTQDYAYWCETQLEGLIPVVWTAQARANRSHNIIQRNERVNENYPIGYNQIIHYWNTDHMCSWLQVRREFVGEHAGPGNLQFDPFVTLSPIVMVAIIFNDFENMILSIWRAGQLICRIVTPHISCALGQICDLTKRPAGKL